MKTYRLRKGGWLYDETGVRVSYYGRELRFETAQEAESFLVKIPELDGKVVDARRTQPS